MELYDKITLYDDDGYPFVIKVFYRGNNAPYNIAPYDIRTDGNFWSTCENLNEVYDEIKNIINLYHLKFMPLGGTKQ